MKLIEAMKKIKDLLRKAEDLREKISRYCAYRNVETPSYENQKAKIQSWLDAHHDLVQEIESLRLLVQSTNLETAVTIELGKNNVTKSIAAWIHRRRDLADLELKAYQQLTDKGIREGWMKNAADESVEIKIIRCYDIETRDEKQSEYLDEPSLIDARLEVVNATTELVQFKQI